MNIGQALERVAEINRNQENVSNLSQLIETIGAPRFTVKVFTKEHRHDLCEIHADLLLAAMHESAKRNRGEADKLNAVISIANSALKGMAYD